MATIDPRVIEVVKDLAPTIADLVKSAFKRRHAEELTDEAVHGALQAHFPVTLAVDDAWLKAHPEPGALTNKKPEGEGSPENG